MKLNKVTFTALAVFALVLQPVYAVVTGATAYAANETVTISTAAELRSAIENQDDGQTWHIQPGTYAVSQTSAITAGGQTGWYFPIVKDNITINGIGNPTIYGSGFTANGNWATQDLVAVFGNNVTINGLTLMPKVEPNKTVEVLGNNFTLTNTVITPNTLTAVSEYSSITDPSWANEAKEWGGSLYFNHAGDHTITNVTINNAGISYRYSPSGTNIAFNNVKLVDATNVDWINGYRYSSGFNNAGNTVTGAIAVEYRVSAALGNLASVLANLKEGDTIVLDSDITTTSQITLNKAGVTFDGNGHTLTANFVKTDNGNNSAIGVQANDVAVKNVTLDGVNPAANQLHGVNAYMAQNLLVDGVTAKNFRTGILYNGSTGTIQNVHTINNIWHGINIDKAGANVNVLGNNTHTEDFNIYVDNDTVGVVVNAPAYDWSRSGLTGRDNDRVYRKKVVVTPETPVTPTEPTTPQSDGDNGEVPVSGGSGAASSSSDTDVAIAESTTTTNESKDAEVLGTDESDVDTSSAQDTKEEKHWSLVNVLLAGVAVVMSISTLAGIRGSEGRAKWLRILTIIPAVGAIIAVLTVEDFTATLGWVNGWTLLFVAIAIAQTVLMTSVKPADN